MKGFIFTEFLQMVEEKYGFVIADAIVEQANLPSKGVYTAVGTYSFSEMVLLLTNLSTEVNEAPATLLKLFGWHFFDVVENRYATFLQKSTDSFSLFQQLDNYIHPEVKKLYPEADLPKFDAKRLDENTLELIYSSEKMMGDFAEGLMEKCGEYFGEKLIIERNNLDIEGKKVQFIIIRG